MESVDYARLILEAKDTGFAEVKATVARLQQQLSELTASYTRGELSLDEYRASGLRLQQQLDQEAGALKTAEDALKRHGDAAKAGVALTQQSRTGMSGLTQAIQAGGYALQDFASAGGGVAQKLGAISNNIPAIVAGLGVAGPWGVAISAAVASLAALAGSWEAIWRSFQAKNPFPKGADDIAELSRQLDAAKEGMKKLREQAELTDAELAHYTALRTEAARLERQIADAQERQKSLKELHETPTPAVTSYKEAYEKGVVATGEGGRFHADLESALSELDANRQTLLDKLVATTGDIEKLDVEPEKRAKMLEEARAEYAKGIQGIDQFAAVQANELIQQLSKGNEQAFRAVRDLVNRAPQRFSDTLREGLKREDPVNRRAAELEEQGSQIEAQARAELAQARKEQAEADAKRFRQQIKVVGGILGAESGAAARMPKGAAPMGEGPDRAAQHEQARARREREEEPAGLAALARQVKATPGPELSEAEAKEEAKRVLEGVRERTGGGFSPAQELRAAAAAIKLYSGGMTADKGEAALEAGVREVLREVQNLGERVRGRRGEGGPAPRASLPPAIEGPPVVPMGPMGLVSALSSSVVGAIEPSAPAPPAPAPAPVQAPPTDGLRAAVGALDARSSDAVMAFGQAVIGFQQVVGSMAAQQAQLGGFMRQVARNNADLQQRLQTAQRQWGR